MDASAASLVRASLGDKLKIAHVITRFIRGGADENTLITCNGQAARGHEVVLIHGAETHPDILARVDARVRVIAEPTLLREISPLADARCLVALRRHFEALQPDLVHTHESKAGVLGRAAAKLAGVPLVVHGVHILAHLNSGPVKSAVYRAADWAAAKVTDVFIDVSEGMRDAGIKAGMGRPDNHVVVESGMDLKAFRSAEAPSDAMTQLAALEPANPLFILAAGALEPRKRIVEFLPVFARLAAEASDVCLLIAGDGPERQKLHAEIERLGLSRRVAHLGHRADLASWIALADVCVHCAEREGLPRVVVQYAASGKPIIVGALPGISRIVRDGETGFVTDLADLDAMRAPLLRLVKDADLRARMGAAAAALDLDAWSDERMVVRVEEAYQAALAKAARRAAN
ncbi:MAG: glycosyltransferase [Hyphomonadaceae bacterium]